MNLTVSFFINGHLREAKQITTPCAIGRGGQSNWVLGHPMLSRKHCVLFDKNGELYLCDDGSLNGIRVQGVPAKEPVRLQLGDEFTVGRDLKFRVSAPIEKEQNTGRAEYAERTTTVFAKDEFPSQLSTVLAKESALQRG